MHLFDLAGYLSVLLHVLRVLTSCQILADPLQALNALLHRFLLLHGKQRLLIIGINSLIDCGTFFVLLFELVVQSEFELNVFACCSLIFLPFVVKQGLEVQALFADITEDFLEPIQLLLVIFVLLVLEQRFVSEPVSLLLQIYDFLIFLDLHPLCIGLPLQINYVFQNHFHLPAVADEHLVGITFDYAVDVVRKRLQFMMHFIVHGVDLFAPLDRHLVNACVLQGLDVDSELHLFLSDTAADEFSKR